MTKLDVIANQAFLNPIFNLLGGPAIYKRPETAGDRDCGVIQPLLARLPAIA
jgi:hypothetical protein